MKYLLIFISIFIIFNKQTFAQSNNTEAAVYNIGLGSIFGGVGAVINKKPNEKFGKTFFKGMYKGAMGGYLIYESKNILKKMNATQTWKYAWGAKIVNAIGVSVVENTALNKGALSQINLSIGFNRIEFYTQNKLHVKYKILPTAFLLTTYASFTNKFEFEKSIQLGNLIYSNDKIISNAAGVTFGNLIVFNRSQLDNISITIHEYIHVFQYYDYNVFNTYTHKIERNWKIKSKFFNQYSRYFYSDIVGAISLTSIYAIEGVNLESKQTYYKNFFEHEAGYYSGTN